MAKNIPALLERKPIALFWDRGLPTFLNGWLSLVKWRGIEPLRLMVTQDTLFEASAEIKSFIDSGGRRSADFSDWVCEDIYSLLTDFFHHSGAEKVRLYLTPREDQFKDDVEACPLKLYCSYGASRISWQVEEDEKKLMPLDVLILKGVGWPGKSGPLIRLKKNGPITDAILLEIEYVC